MRVAFKLRRIPLRDELAGGPIDAEWLLETATRDDVIVHVDEDGPGVAAIRRAGTDVHIAPKRIVDVGGQMTGDEAAMRHLEAIHREQPLDRIVVGGDVGVDPRWHTIGLVDVPVLMTIGESPHRLAPLVTDRHLAQRHLTAVWSAAGALATADAQFGSAAPSAYGISDLDDVPRVLPVRPASLAEEIPAHPALLVVVATAASRSDLGDLVTRVEKRVDIGPATTIVCVVADVDLGNETAGDLVAAGAPPGLRHSVIVAYTGQDGVAKAFLDQADLVVALGPADLAVHAVADRSHACPTIVLDASAVGSPSRWDESIAMEPTSELPAQVLSADGELAGLADLIERSDAPLHVLHTASGSALALLLHERPSALGAGITVVCQADAVHGTPRPERPVPSVVAIDRSAVPSAVRLLRASPDLWTFIRLVLDPANAARLHLRLLPAPLGTRAVDIAAAPEGMPAWFGRGPLEGASGVAIMRMESAPAKAAVATPSVRAWVRQHRWPDRIRLALPWKGGMLERAMKDRW